METPEMYCPRRHESALARNFPGPDAYREDDNSCTYCGSLNPDEFMRRLEAGDIEIGTTNKNYKVYVHNLGGEPFKQTYRDCPRGSAPHMPDECDHWVTREIEQTKFYFQHLSQDQRERFVELLNAKSLRFAGGYGFSPLPFFYVPAGQKGK